MFVVVVMFMLWFKNSGCYFTISPWVNLQLFAVAIESFDLYISKHLISNPILKKMRAFDLRSKLISMAIDTMSFIITPSMFINNQNSTTQLINYNNIYTRLILVSIAKNVCN